MRASRSRTRERTNLLASTPDEAALAIACFLITARDLLSLQLTNKRFSRALTLVATSVRALDLIVDLGR